jgi:ribonuclease HI
MNNKYKLYTDASKRDRFAVIAGVILNEKNKPIIEFVKEDSMLSTTNDLEKKAFLLGLNLAKEHGVKLIV